MTRALVLLLVAALARAHGDHAANIQSRADDESLSYAERHVRTSECERRWRHEAKEPASMEILRSTELQ